MITFKTHKKKIAPYLLGVALIFSMFVACARVQSVRAEDAVSDIEASEKREHAGSETITEELPMTMNNSNNAMIGIEDDIPAAGAVDVDDNHPSDVERLALVISILVLLFGMGIFMILYEKNDDLK